MGDDVITIPICGWEWAVPDDAERVHWFTPPLGNADVTISGGLYFVHAVTDQLLSAEWWTEDGETTMILRWREVLQDDCNSADGETGEGK